MQCCGKVGGAWGQGYSCGVFAKTPIHILLHASAVHIDLILTGYLTGVNKSFP